MMRSAFDRVSACASVLATTKSQPTRPAVIMLLTALPPAPPTPNTVILGLSSRMSGSFRLMVMAGLLSERTRGLAACVGRSASGRDEKWCRSSGASFPKSLADSARMARRQARLGPRAVCGGVGKQMVKVRPLVGAKKRCVPRALATCVACGFGEAQLCVAAGTAPVRPEIPPHAIQRFPGALRASRRANHGRAKNLICGVCARGL